MKTAEELVRFTAFAEKQGMDTNSDDEKFLNLATAAAWTKWLTEVHEFERSLEKDDQAASKEESSEAK